MALEREESEANLEEIRGYLRLSERLATAGQPDAAQLEDIRDAGFEVVLNLAVGESPQALRREGEIVAALGMEYRHLPVVWKHPTPEDFAQFREAMMDYRERVLFVHCIANMRVSAFLFLYRVLQEGWTPEAASQDLHRVWMPDPIWQRFIDTMLTTWRESGGEEGNRPSPPSPSPINGRGGV